MATIRVKNTIIGYNQTGNGAAVVFVHAGCADRRMWHHQVSALARYYRVICYDLRGYGESGDAAGDFAHHEDLLALLDALGVDRCALVGSSDGGKIALDAALTAPHRISALALVASGLSGHTWPPAMPAQFQERVHNVIGPERLRQYRAGEVPVIDADELERYCEAETEYLVAGPGRRRRDLPPEAWKLALAMNRQLNQRNWSRRQADSRTLEPPARGRLGEVAVPTLVVSGAADVPEIIALSDLLGNIIHGAHRVSLAQTGHLPPLERPAEFNPVLLNFLAGLKSL